VSVSSVRTACISSDVVSDWADTTVVAGNADAVVLYLARCLICLSVWSSSTEEGGSPRIWRA